MKIFLKYESKELEKKKYCYIMKVMENLTKIKQKYKRC
jgi:hypothetical protein